EKRDYVHSKALMYRTLLEKLSLDNRDRPLVFASLKSIKTRLINEVLAVVETTVWSESEYITQVTRLNETLNTLEKELLSQYQSNLLKSINQSAEAVTKRFENLKTLVNNEFDKHSYSISDYYIKAYLELIKDFEILPVLQPQM